MSGNQEKFTQFDKGEEIVSAVINPTSGKLISVTNDGRVLQLEHEERNGKITTFWKQIVGTQKRL